MAAVVRQAAVQAAGLRQASSGAAVAAAAVVKGSQQEGRTVMPHSSYSPHYHGQGEIAVRPRDTSGALVTSGMVRAGRAEGGGGRGSGANGRDGGALGGDGCGGGGRVRVGAGAAWGARSGCRVGLR